MRFAEPLWLLLLLPLPLLWRWGFGLIAGTPDALAGLGSPESLRANQKPEQRALLLRSLSSAAWLLTVVALAQLEGPSEATVLPGRGLDVLVAVDTSRSMSARDLSPDRLVAARILVESLSQRLQGDRMALMAFSGVAHLQCPFTADLSIFRRYLQQLEAGALPVGGTDLSQAVDLALEIFERAGDGERVLLLLTDGENHSGEELKKMGVRLKEAGVKTHLVAVGSDLGEPVPDPQGGYLRDRSGRPVVSRTDRKSLQAMAEAADGDYFSLQPGSPAADQLERAILALDREASRPSRQERRPRWYLVVLAAAWLLAALARRIPAQLAVLLVLPLLGAMGGMRHQDPDAKRGLTLLEEGKTVEALAAFDTAAKRGASPALDYNRGLALLAQGESEKAATAFGRAAARFEGPRLADAEAARGMALARAGDKKQALKALTKALRLQPGHAVATPWLRHLLAPRPKPPEKEDKDEKEDPEDKDQGDDPQEPKGGDAGPSQDAGSDRDSGGQSSPSQGQQGGADGGPDPEKNPETSSDAGAQASPSSPSDAGPQSSDSGPASQPKPSQPGDAGPEDEAQNILRNYRARERLLPLDHWKGSRPRRPVEKDW
jgi:Ca-activated chloride channel family protein